MQPRIIGRITPWFCSRFETCTKRAMRQSRSRAAVWRWCEGRLCPYKGPVNHESHPMNPANLPFDSEAMLQGLRTWVECESPTWDAGAVERMLELAARDMAIMGASIERIAGRQGFAGCVGARFPHPKAGEPGILIAGHFDTVHPVGTIQKLPWRREDGKCFAPWISDLKARNSLPL